MSRPGIMIYFDILKPIEVLPDADKGRLLVAMLEYAQTGKEPAFVDMLEMAWRFIKPKIDKDEASYNLSILRHQYATECRERKRKEEPAITFDEWLKMIGNHDTQELSMMTNDDQRYPTTSTSSSANASSSTPASTAAAAPPTKEGSDASKTYEEQLRMIHGTLGKGVVRLTAEQLSDLIVKMGIDDFEEYMVRLANFIIENDAHIQNHYETILKWWREDTSIES